MPSTFPRRRDERVRAAGFLQLGKKKSAAAGAFVEFPFRSEPSLPKSKHHCRPTDRFTTPVCSGPSLRHIVNRSRIALVPGFLRGLSLPDNKRNWFLTEADRNRCREKREMAKGSRRKAGMSEDDPRGDLRALNALVQGVGLKFGRQIHCRILIGRPLVATAPSHDREAELARSGVTWGGA